MSKPSKRIARRQRFQRPVTDSGPAIDFDLRKIKLTDISEVKLDAADNECVIQIQLPVSGGESYALYEETIDFDEEEVPGYLRDAARRMYEAAERAVRERVYTHREVPCATCTGACCGRMFTSVRLTAEDIKRLEEVVDITQQVITYEQVAFTGHVGEFRQIPWFGDEEQQACPNLTPEGCGIYDHRPLVCREYSAWDCDIYEADDDKIEGRTKHKLQVIE